MKQLLTINDDRTAAQWCPTTSQLGAQFVVSAPITDL